MWGNLISLYFYCSVLLISQSAVFAKISGGVHHRVETIEDGTSIIEYISEPPVHTHFNFINHQRKQVVPKLNVAFNGEVVQVAAVNTQAYGGVPLVQTAVLSDDGRYCTVTFNVPTDQGGYDYTFPCTSLLSFNGDTTATCFWQDSSDIVIYPDLDTSDEIANALNVGSLIMLGIGNNINSVCPAGSTAATCVTGTAYPQTQIVEAPANPVTPVVVINAPAVISSCATWSVDLTSSTGDGGRGWITTNVTVSSSNSANVTALTIYFREGFNAALTSKPFTIPSAAFVVGSLYSVTVRLCNFLYNCGSATVDLRIATVGSTPPVASIVGQQASTLYTTSTLSLTGSGYVTNCQGNPDTSGLTYEWFIANATGTPTVIPGIGSASKNPTIFLLPAYTIQGAGKYIVVLTVTDTHTTLSSQASVDLTVLPSPIVAAVSPSSQQLVKVGKTIVFSGQNSFDPDNLIDGIEGMKFHWQCVQQLPTAGLSCPFNFRNVTSIGNSKIQASPLTAAINGTFIVTMFVLKGNRNATTSVSVKVIDGNAPLITILTSAAALTGINPANRVLVSARIQSNFTCLSLWTTTSSSLVLSKNTLVPTNSTIKAKVPATVNLYLSANALAAHSTYSFSLSCERSVATVVVTTNGPPVGGTYSALNQNDQTPSGIELTTIFEFLTAQWSDPELPITYSFGFVTPGSGLISTVQSRSQTSYAQTTLPGAPNGLKTVVTVYDQVNCSASLNQTVFVSSLPSSQAQAIIYQQLNSTSGSTSIDAIKAVISVASATLSAVNCTGVTDLYCSSLHRSPCASTSQTCGSCLSGYLGDSGDANALCFNATALNNTSINVNTRCSSSSDCPALYTCQSSSQTCIPVQQSCPNNCTNNGRCLFLDSSTGAQVASCPLVSTSCLTSCSCFPGFQGADCSLTSKEASSQQQLRFLLLSSLSTVVNNEDATNETVSSAVASVTALVQNTADLNNASISVYQGVTQATVFNAASYDDIEVSSVSGLLASADVAIQAQSAISGTSTPANASSPLEYATQIVSNYNVVLGREQVAGQKPVTQILNNFRTSSVEQSVSATPQISMTVPVTQLEQLTGTLASSVATTITNTSIDAVNFQLSQFSASLINPPNQTKILSNVLQVSVSASSTPVIIKIAHVAEFVQEKQLNFTSICLGPSDTRIINYTCPVSGYFIQHNCVGRTGPMSSQCPVHSPQCNLVNATGSNPYSSEGVCSVVNSTSSYTICSCLTNVSVDPYSGRRLDANAEWNTFAYNTGIVNIVAMSEYTTNELSTTFTAAPDLFSAQALEQVLTVIVMFCVLWIGGMSIVCATVYKQQKSKNKYSQKLDILTRSLAKEPPSKANMKKSLERYVKSVFPSVFYQDNWLLKLKEEIVKNHLYLTLLTSPKGELEDKRRIISGVRLLTVQSSLMCLLAIFYDLQSPADDGSCNGLVTQQTCLQRTSILDDTQTYCQWTQVSPDAPDGTCSFNNPEITFKTALYVQVIVSVISLFIMKPMDYCFDLLLAPTEKEMHITRAKEHTMESSFYSTSIIQTGVRRMSAMLLGRGSIRPLQPQQLQQLENLKRQKRSSSVRQITDAVQRNHIVAQAILKSAAFTLDESIKIPTPEEVTQRDFNELIEMVFNQRAKLSEHERSDYDILWGIENGTEIRQDVKDKIIRHLATVEEDYPKLKEKILDPSLTQSIRGLEILYEFILDLLGRDTPAAKIFRAKSEEDFQQYEVISVWKKVTAGLAIVGLNFFFVFYSILRGYVRGQQWQHDYLVACIVQMISEIFLFQTMECVWINFIVPNLVAKEVHRTNGIIEALIQRVCDHINHDGHENHILNSAEYLFMSRKLAALHPHLIESILVFSYRNHLPGEVSRKWIKNEERNAIMDPSARLGTDPEYNEHRARQLENRHRSWTEFSFVASLLVSLQLVGTFPFFIQKMIVRFVQPFFYGGMVNAFEIVFSDTTDTIIFVIILVIILAFVLFQFVLMRKRASRIQHERDAHGTRDTHVMQVKVQATPVSGVELLQHKQRIHDDDVEQPLLPRQQDLTNSNEDSKGDEHDEAPAKPRLSQHKPHHRPKDGEGKEKEHHHHHHHHHHHGKGENNEDRKSEDGRAANAAQPKSTKQIFLEIKNDSEKVPEAKPRDEDTDSSVSTIHLPVQTYAKAQMSPKVDQIREGQAVDESDLGSSNVDDLFSFGQNSSLSGDAPKQE